MCKACPGKGQEEGTQGEKRGSQHFFLFIIASGLEPNMEGLAKEKTYILSFR